MRKPLWILLLSSLIIGEAWYVYADKSPEYWNTWWHDRTVWKDGKIDTIMTPDFPFAEVPEGYEFGTVLQLGAGDGKYFKYLLQERGWEVTKYIGVDWTAEAINIIQQRKDQGDFGSTEVVLYQEDFSDISYLEDNSVDLVFSVDSLSHLSNNIDDLEGKIHLMGEIARVLKPSGSILLVNEFFDCEPVEDMIRPISDKLQMGVLITEKTYKTVKTADMLPND